MQEQGATPWAAELPPMLRGRRRAESQWGLYPRALSLPLWAKIPWACCKRNCAGPVSSRWSRIKLYFRTDKSRRSSWRACSFPACLSRRELTPLKSLSPWPWLRSSTPLFPNSLLASPSQTGNVDLPMTCVEHSIFPCVSQAVSPDAGESTPKKCTLKSPRLIPLVPESTAILLTECCSKWLLEQF